MWCWISPGYSGQLCDNLICILGSLNAYCKLANIFHSCRLNESKVSQPTEKTVSFGSITAHPSFSTPLTVPPSDPKQCFTPDISFHTPYDGEEGEVKTDVVTSCVIDSHMPILSVFVKEKTTTQLAGVDASSVDTVDTTTIDATTVDAPTVDAPTVDAPTVDAPTVDAPIVDTPTVVAATVESSNVDTPNVIAATVESSNVDAPTVDAPTVVAPTVVAPTVVAPTVDAPTVDAPTVDAPTVDAPTVDAPTVDAPTVDAPTVDAPTVDAPTVDAPTVDAGTVHIAVVVPATDDCSSVDKSDTSKMDDVLLLAESRLNTGVAGIGGDCEPTRHHSKEGGEMDTGLVEQGKLLLVSEEAPGEVQCSMADNGDLDQPVMASKDLANDVVMNEEKNGGSHEKREESDMEGKGVMIETTTTSVSTKQCQDEEFEGEWTDTKEILSECTFYSDAEAPDEAADVFGPVDDDSLSSRVRHLIKASFTAPPVPPKLAPSADSVPLMCPEPPPLPPKVPIKTYRRRHQKPSPSKEENVDLGVLVSKILSVASLVAEVVKEMKRESGSFSRQVSVSTSLTDVPVGAAADYMKTMKPLQFGEEYCRSWYIVTSC